MFKTIVLIASVLVRSLRHDHTNRVSFVFFEDRLGFADVLGFGIVVALVPDALSDEPR